MVKKHAAKTIVLLAPPFSLTKELIENLNNEYCYQEFSKLNHEMFGQSDQHGDIQIL